MPVFSYTALKSGKNKVTGKIEASSMKDARDALRRLDLIPTKIEEQVDSSTQVKPKFNFSFGGSGTGSEPGKSERVVKIPKLSMREKIDFTNTLYILSKTGISIIEALLFIELNASTNKVRRLAIELRRQVLLGSNLSDAVAKYPETFDFIYSGLIRAGEASGELDTTLRRMMDLLDKQDKLKSKIISTMAYPAFMIVLANLVTLVMLCFVFPAFKDMYDNMGQKLPLITQVLMDLGMFLKKYWFTIPIFFGTVGYAIYFILTWPVSRRVIDNSLLHIPVLDNFVKLTALSNFLSVLKVSFDAGVPILDSLMLANMTIQNMKIQKVFREAAMKIQHGMSLSTALKATNVVPGIIMCMISTGEQSGQLGDMLEQCSIFIDTMLDRIVDLLNKLAEPMLLVVIGGIVMVLALALYLPLFQSYANMG